jgi:hypothetical protein
VLQAGGACRHIVDDGDQLGNPPDTQRRHDPELAEAASNQIRQHGLLLHQDLARAVERQHGLLLGRLDCREPHRRAAHCFANRFRIESIALATLHVRLDVPSRH